VSGTGPDALGAFQAIEIIEGSGGFVLDDLQVHGTGFFARAAFHASVGIDLEPTFEAPQRALHGSHGAETAPGAGVNPKAQRNADPRGDQAHAPEHMPPVMPVRGIGPDANRHKRHQGDKDNPAERSVAEKRGDGFPAAQRRDNPVEKTAPRTEIAAEIAAPRIAQNHAGEHHDGNAEAKDRIFPAQP